MLPYANDDPVLCAPPRGPGLRGGDAARRADRERVGHSQPLQPPDHSRPRPVSRWCSTPASAPHRTPRSRWSWAATPCSSRRRSLAPPTRSSWRARSGRASKQGGSPSAPDGFPSVSTRSLDVVGGDRRPRRPTRRSCRLGVMSRLGDARRERLARARLYLVTGRPPRRRAISTAFLDAVLDGRRRHRATPREGRRGRRPAALESRSSGPLPTATARSSSSTIVPDVAVAVGADGVHRRAERSPAQDVRGSIVGPRRSHRAVDPFQSGVRRRRHPDADYLCIGPVYATPTKPGRDATGLATVSHAASRERERSRRKAVVCHRWHRHPATLPDDRRSRGASRVVGGPGDHRIALTQPQSVSWLDRRHCRSRGRVS